MPKRKPNLSKNMRKAKSQRLQRENESQQDRESHLRNCRLRISMSRSNECSSERNERLLSDRIRHSLLRSQKYQESREQCLENDRIQHAVSRRLESDDSREQVAINFGSKNPKDLLKKRRVRRHKRIKRLAQLRESVSAIRQAETNFDQERRLFTSRQTTSALRDIEGEENRRQRLNNDQIRNLLVKGKIFGCVRCFMYSLEWQKRGLPHAHILIWLKTKIRGEQIDDVIRAELPDQEVDQSYLMS
ncbi:helitron_like_N domain-containing protein [Trichonephila clavipes]|nr:helitron_like_N domain-containing protein [Trichonephila clavipes]